MEAVNREDVKDYSEIPVPDDNRERTDVFCTIFSSLFAITIFIVACATFNVNNLRKMTYPADSEGGTCGWDIQNYNYLYYTTLSDPSKRLCVSQCPKAGDTTLSCHPTENLSCSQNDNPKYEVQIYDTELDYNRIGLFCLPTDPDARKQVLEMSGVQSKYTFLSFYDAMWFSIWFTAVIGIVLLFFLYCFPRQVVNWMYILGAITYITVGILLCILPSGFIVWKLIPGLLLIFIGILNIIEIFKAEYRKEILVCGRLMENANEVFKYNFWIVMYVPIFILFLVGLIFLTAFQLLAVWSMGSMNFDPSYPFYTVGGFGKNFLSALVFCEFFWGMSFLKEAFNFCVSGFATNWYCYRENDETKIHWGRSFKLLLKYHWGSVVGGSLLLLLFYFIDLFVDFFCSTDRDVKKREHNPEPFHREVVEHGSCAAFFNLIRSESMGYINLIPIPYCNASRYSEMMSDESGFYDRSQTTNRLYRLSCHAVIVAICTGVSIAATRTSDRPITILGVVFISLVSMFMITFFISFQSDVAEGLLISVFIEERMTNNMEELHRPPECMKKLYIDDKEDYFEKNNTCSHFLKGEY